MGLVYARRMDRAMIEKHLAQAEQHVADGERHITRQRQIIAELERDDHDAGSAKELLTIFEETQAIHIADRDRLKEEARIADQRSGPPRHSRSHE
jgi:hypothetical protein